MPERRSRVWGIEPGDVRKFRAASGKSCPYRVSVGSRARGRGQCSTGQGRPGLTGNEIGWTVYHDPTGEAGSTEAPRLHPKAAARMRRAAVRVTVTVDEACQQAGCLQEVGGALPEHHQVPTSKRPKVVKRGVIERQTGCAAAPRHLHTPVCRPPVARERRRIASSSRRRPADGTLGQPARNKPADRGGCERQDSTR